MRNSYDKVVLNTSLLYNVKNKCIKVVLDTSYYDVNNKLVTVFDLRFCQLFLCIISQGHKVDMGEL